MDQEIIPEQEDNHSKGYSKKNPVYLKTLSKLRLTSLPPTLFLTNLFLGARAPLGIALVKKKTVYLKTLSKREGGRSTSIWIMSLNILGFF